MLQDLLKLLKDSEDRLTKSDICRALNVSPARLDNMLLVLEQKGKIRLVSGLGTEVCQEGGSCSTSGKECPGLASCALVMEMPLGIEVLDRS